MGKEIRKLFKPIQWAIIDGVPDKIVPVDELNRHDFSLLKEEKFDDSGVPYTQLINVSFLNGNAENRIRITEVTTYKPCEWVQEIKDKYAPNEIEPVYETWIEIVDNRTGISSIYKLEKGTLVCRDVTDELIRRYEEPEEETLYPFDTEF